MTSRVVSVSFVAGGLILVLAYALAQLLPPGVDFYYWSYKVAQAWWAGDTRLYDDASRGYYLPPWAVWLFLPFSFLDAGWGMAFFTLASMVIVAGVSFLYARENVAQRPALVAAAAGLSAYAMETYILGMPDAWCLAGIFLSYLSLKARRPLLFGAGLVLALVRPQNLLLTIPAMLLAARTWTARQKLLALLPVLLTLAASGLLFGWDWPLRWMDNYRTQPPSSWGVTTTYTAFGRFGVPFWLTAFAALVLAALLLRRITSGSFDRRALELTLAAGAAVSPYIRGPSYVVLMALPWSGLAARRPWLAALCYLLTLPTIVLPLLFYEQLGSLWVQDVPLLEVAFPVVLTAALLLEEWSQQRVPRAVVPAAVS